MCPVMEFSRAKPVVSHFFWMFDPAGCWLLRAIWLLFHVQGWICSSEGRVGDVWCQVTGSFVGGRVWVRITMGQIGIGLAWRKCNTCGGMYRGK